MSMKEHFELLATYNETMNAKVYSAAGRLGVDELARDRGAFFGSILGTLNHLVVADTIWLKRFAAHPSCRAALGDVVSLASPQSLDQMLFQDFGELAERRVWLDQLIVSWVSDLADADLDTVLSYHNTRGIPASKQLSGLILHFFNHQTHHRGQASTLLSQAGEDIGVTDLLVLVPNEGPV